MTNKRSLALEKIIAEKTNIGICCLSGPGMVLKLVGYILSYDDFGYLVKGRCKNNTDEKTYFLPTGTIANFELLEDLGDLEFKNDLTLKEEQGQSDQNNFEFNYFGSYIKTQNGTIYLKEWESEILMKLENAGMGNILGYDELYGTLNKYFSLEPYVEGKAVPSSIRTKMCQIRKRLEGTSLRLKIVRGKGYYLDKE